MAQKVEVVVVIPGMARRLPTMIVRRMAALQAVAVRILCVVSVRLSEAVIVHMTLAGRSLRAQEESGAISVVWPLTSERLGTECHTSPLDQQTRRKQHAVRSCSDV